VLKTGVNRLFNFVLYSNFWIATAAAAQVWLSFRVARNISMYRFDYICAVFFGTWSFYALLRCIKLLDGSFQVADSERIAVLFRRKWHLVFLTFITGVFALLFAKNLPFMLLITLLFCTLFALTYGWNFGFSPLRRLPYLKSFLVPIVWVIVVVLLPVLLTPTRFEQAFLWYAPERFLFIFALTMPFDLRDTATDARLGIISVPSRLGAQGAVILACILLSIGYVLSDQSLITTIVYLLAFALVYHTRKPRHDYWYSGALDGLLILQPMLVFLQQSAHFDR
jgi:hypothetical protein